MNSAQTQVLMGALGAAAQIALARHGQAHDQAMLQLKHGALSQITEALITRRVVAVKDGFIAILDQYGEQARHLMGQEAKFGDEQLHATDPLLRVELSQRIKDIDVQLGYIRADAALLYGRMTEVVLLLGGTRFDFGGDLGGALGLSGAMIGALP